MVEEELRYLRRELKEAVVSTKSNYINEKKLKTVLETLSVTDVNLAALKKIKIGRTLNDVRKKLRKSTSISRKTSEILHKWKKIATDEFLQSKRIDKTDRKVLKKVLTKTMDSDKKEGDFGDGDITSSFRIINDTSRDSNYYRQKEDRSSDDEDQSDSSEKETNEHVMRKKSIEMIEEALCSNNSTSILQDSNPHKIAENVEESIFAQFMDARNNKYRSRVRSRVANLKDELNLCLREMVLRGMIRPEKLATMTSEELANDKMRKIRRSLTDELKDEHILPSDADTNALSHPCPECCERNSSYRLEHDKQDNRYLICKSCGYQWKAFE